MKRLKQVLAIGAIVVLLSLYLLSLIAAILAKPYAHGLFMASLYCTIAIPILLYGFMLIYRVVHKDSGMSIRDMKRANRNLKQEEAEEDKNDQKE